jgi:hypothetical protein
MPELLAPAIKADYTTESKGPAYAKGQADDWALDCI